MRTFQYFADNEWHDPSMGVGRLLAVVPFESKEQAVRLANDSEFGLASGPATHVAVLVWLIPLTRVRCISTITSMQPRNLPLAVTNSLDTVVKVELR